MAIDWGAVGGGGLSALGSLGGGLLSSASAASAAKKQIKAQYRLHEESAAAREMYSQMARADQEIAQKNLLAGEQAKLNLLSSLGQPGTYGPGPGSVSGPLSLGVLQPTGISGLTPQGLATSTLKKSGFVTGEDVRIKEKPKYLGVKNWEVSGEVINPEALTAQIQGTSGFRTVSKMVAEAEQLMNREGPLWNQLNNSIVGGIYETNAAFQRQAMEQVARSVARGGTARRVGLGMAQAFQVQEQVNRTRTGQLWQAKMQLEEYRTNYAQQVTNFSQAWVNNEAGVRDSFSNALQNLQMFWSTTMAPTLAGATVNAQSATQRGILNASQGIMDAAGVKSQAISGAINGIIGVGQQILGGLFPQNQESSSTQPTPSGIAFNP